MKKHNIDMNPDKLELTEKKCFEDRDQLFDSITKLFEDNNLETDELKSLLGNIDSCYEQIALSRYLQGLNDNGFSGTVGFMDDESEMTKVIVLEDESPDSLN